ncbi:MAG: NifB/NifX family molybdenum-iron cluster-binding protein [Desulfotomaculales bacterium]
MVKLALATDGRYVAAHFGHCPAYTLAEVEDGQAKSVTTIPNPGHQPGFLPAYLSELGVTHVIAGGMGPRAQELFAARGITTIIGVQGTVNEVLDAFLAGKLAPGPSLCDHGAEGHGHGGGCGHGGGRCGGQHR